MNKILSALLGLPKTIWFNLRYLPLKQGICFPIILAFNVKIRKMYLGGVKFSNNELVKLGIIRIGFHCVEPLDTYSTHTILAIEKHGTIIFNGTAHIGHGAIIHVAGGRLVLGNNFAISGNTSIVCKNHISIGDNVQFSYNGLVLDSDAHKIFDENGNQFPNSAPIKIGDNVWIAPNVTIQKGSQISSNTVVASNSLVNKNFTENSILIGGIPAKILKHIRNWEL